MDGGVLRSIVLDKQDARSSRGDEVGPRSIAVRPIKIAPSTKSHRPEPAIAPLTPAFTALPQSHRHLCATATATVIFLMWFAYDFYAPFPFFLSQGSMEASSTTILWGRG
uniref:Uncharacterized protein n=1 Tax=Arundo donax TaxID=35708 RepID=A0A0A9DJE8_ARUDO